MAEIGGNFTHFMLDFLKNLFLFEKPIEHMDILSVDRDRNVSIGVYKKKMIRMIWRVVIFWIVCLFVLFPLSILDGCLDCIALFFIVSLPPLGVLILLVVLLYLYRKSYVVNKSSGDKLAGYSEVRNIKSQTGSFLVDY